MKRSGTKKQARRDAQRPSPTPAETLIAFERAPDFSRFRDVELVSVVRRSRAWFERCRWAGDGIPYVRDGRNIFYVKKDVLAWLERQQRCTSTSDYETHARQVPVRRREGAVA